MLNRKFHITQISHRVKNWYQIVTFEKCEICVRSISIILGVSTLCSNFNSFSFLTVKNFGTYSCHLRMTGSIFLRCEELVLNFHKCEESVPVLHTCEELREHVV